MGHDAESGYARELRKKKRVKCFTYIAAFAVFQTAVIVVFALVIMKARTPKYEIRAAALEGFGVGNQANPSFNFRINARLRVKNNNFGPYKYDNSTIVFSYRGVPVGGAFIPRGKPGFRSSKSFNVVVDVSSTNFPDTTALAGDLASGVIRLNAQSRLQGKAELMWFLYKKRKATQLNCDVAVGLDRSIPSISCQ